VNLVIFDCDGVLIDSEPISHRLLAQEADRLGWALTANDAHRFTGLTWTAIKPAFEQATGQRLSGDWPGRLQARLIEMMRAGVPEMAGARDMLLATRALGLFYRIASNSSHEEMAQKFGFTGLAPLVAGRVHSARDVARGKPAPDVFLAAAAAEGVAPETCLVVEDSGPGLTAAYAAGMQVVAFAPGGLVSNLGFSPHHVIESLAELPELLRAVQQRLAA